MDSKAAPLISAQLFEFNKEDSQILSRKLFYLMYKYDKLDLIGRKQSSE